MQGYEPPILCPVDDPKIAKWKMLAITEEAMQGAFELRLGETPEDCLDILEQFFVYGMPLKNNNLGNFGYGAFILAVDIQENFFLIGNIICTEDNYCQKCFGANKVIMPDKKKIPCPDCKGLIFTPDHKKKPNTPVEN